MLSLEYLEVMLIVPSYLWGNMSTDQAKTLERPLTAITCPRNFELITTCRCLSDEAPWKALPSRILRVERI